jgi:uncharacterized protein (UPF0335 family)
MAGGGLDIHLQYGESKDVMMKFRNSGIHKKAMSKIRKLSHQYKTLRWETDTIPDWEEARQKLLAIDFIKF